MPLVGFRILFGLLMLISTIRFMLKGWVAELYLDPVFHFTYYGFWWVKPVSGPWLYAVFIIIALCCLFVMLGFFYRASITLFFLLFTYVELLDKAYYLNHYYFISVLSFLLIFLPLNRHLSLDALIDPTINTNRVPSWTIWAIRLQVGLVYFFAGLAKLKPDWLFHALPLKIWLAGHTSFPLIGPLFDYAWVAYLMSWSGAIFDLTIPFWLLWRRTRPFAYMTVILFHLLTGALFPIGMFPWIMIASTTIFFSEEEYRALFKLGPHPHPLSQCWERGARENLPLAVYTKQNKRHLSHSLAVPTRVLPPNYPAKESQRMQHAPILLVLMPFFLLQFLLPLRQWLYPGDVTWTEEGYRFAWNVMLVEKTAHTTFYVTEPNSGREWSVYPSDYLTPQQEKQMSYQPDMILQFAHYVAELAQQEGFSEVEVRVEAYVSLNGRASRLLIDPTVDLSQEVNDFRHKAWIVTR